MGSALPRRPALLLTLALASACIVVACEASTAGDGTGAPTPTPTPSAPRPPPTGPDDAPPVADPLTAPDGTCTGAAGSFYSFTLQTLTYKEPLPTCRFEGKVLLVVNVASQCGYTPQYAPLEALYQKYKAQGFYVLGFPSNSFNQELSDEKEISQFCKDEYKITFPMFSLANVNPPDEQPLYTWLKAQPGHEAAIPWNFEKWIVSRKGQVAKRIDYTTSPDDAQVTAAIEAELAK